MKREMLARNSDPILKTRVLGAAGIVLLCGLLTAGLWPFHAPTNEIGWVPGNGVQFGAHATILSSGQFPTPTSATGTTCSLEMWLQPLDLDRGSTLLAFDNPDPMRFSLRQSNCDLVLRRGRLELFIDRVFSRDRPTLITIAATPARAQIYVDGKLVRTLSGFPLSAQDLTGRLVLGNSPVENDSFSGRWRGLALYRNALTEEQVARSYQTWTESGRPNTGSTGPPFSLYLFNEGRGRTIYDYGRSGINLTVPTRFIVLHQTFLEPPWTEFHPTLSYCKDFLINIGGFIPFGLVLQAYLVSRNDSRKGLLLTVVAGLAVSLTIEVLQAFLPTRFSGMTDLFTNTLGTWFGAALYGPTARAFNLQ